MQLLSIHYYQEKKANFYQLKPETTFLYEI